MTSFANESVRERNHRHIIEEATMLYIKSLDKLKYSNSLIEELDMLIQKQDPIKITLFLLRKNINLASLPDNLQINFMTDARNRLDIIQKQFPDEIFKHIVNEPYIKEIIQQVNEKIIKNRAAVIDTLKNTKQNSTQKQGGLFNHLLVKFDQGSQFKTPIITDISQALEHEGDFIFVPNTDDKAIQLLEEKGIHHNSKKGRDLVIKVGNFWLLGEAKKIEDQGGMQKAQLVDMHDNINHNTGTKEGAIGFGLTWGAAFMQNLNDDNSTKKSKFKELCKILSEHERTITWSELIFDRDKAVQKLHTAAIRAKINNESKDNLKKNSLTANNKPYWS